jgi:hypothetical protein
MGLHVLHSLHCTSEVGKEAIVSPGGPSVAPARANDERRLRRSDAAHPGLRLDDLVQQLLRLEEVDPAGEEIEQGPHGAFLLDLLVDEPLQEL